MFGGGNDAQQKDALRVRARPLVAALREARGAEVLQTLSRLYQFYREPSDRADKVARARTVCDLGAVNVLVAVLAAAYRRLKRGKPQQLSPAALAGEKSITETNNGTPRSDQRRRGGLGGGEECSVEISGEAGGGAGDAQLPVASGHSGATAIIVCTEVCRALGQMQFMSPHVARSVAAHPSVFRLISGLISTPVARAGSDGTVLTGTATASLVEERCLKEAIYCLAMQASNNWASHGQLLEHGLPTAAAVVVTDKTLSMSTRAEAIRFITSVCHNPLNATALAHPATGVVPLLGRIVCARDLDLRWPAAAVALAQLGGGGAPDEVVDAVVLTVVQMLAASLDRRAFPAGSGIRVAAWKVCFALRKLVSSASHIAAAAGKAGCIAVLSRCLTLEWHGEGNQRSSSGGDKDWGVMCPSDEELSNMAMAADAALDCLVHCARETQNQRRILADDLLMEHLDALVASSRRLHVRAAMVRALVDMSEADPTEAPAGSGHPIVGFASYIGMASSPATAGGGAGWGGGSKNTQQAVLLIDFVRSGAHHEQRTNWWRGLGGEGRQGEWGGACSQLRPRRQEVLHQIWVRLCEAGTAVKQWHGALERLQLTVESVRNAAVVIFALGGGVAQGGVEDVGQSGGVDDSELPEARFLFHLCGVMRKPVVIALFESNARFGFSRQSGTGGALAAADWWWGMGVKGVLKPHVCKLGDLLPVSSPTAPRYEVTPVTVQRDGDLRRQGSNHDSGGDKSSEVVDDADDSTSELLISVACTRILRALYDIGLSRRSPPHCALGAASGGKMAAVRDGRFQDEWGGKGNGGWEHPAPWAAGLDKSAARELSDLDEGEVIQMLTALGFSHAAHRAARNGHDGKSIAAMRDRNDLSLVQAELGLGTSDALRLLADLSVRK